MPEKVISRDERARSNNKKDDFDFRPMQKGITLLKFGSRGPAHEKVFKLSGDKRYITWGGRWFSPKLGKQCVGKALLVIWYIQTKFIMYDNRSLSMHITVDLERAIRLQSGQMTYKFERLGTLIFVTSLMCCWSNEYYTLSDRKTFQQSLV